jgi:hypothetical protein
VIAERFCGSTGVNKNRRGGDVEPVATSVIPISLKRKVNFKG